MTMTVDEALEMMRGANPENYSNISEEYAACVLAAEVERLRAEHDRLYPHGVNFFGNGTLYGTESTCRFVGGWIEGQRAEIERLQKVVADQALTIGVLKDEIATERDCSSGLTEDVLKAEAKLKWFEEREAVARRAIDYAKADWDTDSNVIEYWKARRSLLDWEAANPKPHDPDALDKHLAGKP